MGTTAQKLAYLSDTKAVIKQAIVSKGIAVPDGTTFREYAKKISSIHDVSSLPTQDAKTVIPTTTEQIAVASGRYTTGDVKVAGDANLVAENIAEGVSIFGVVGTHVGGGALQTAAGYLHGDTRNELTLAYFDADTNQSKVVNVGGTDVFNPSPTEMNVNSYIGSFIYLSFGQPESGLKSVGADCYEITGDFSVAGIY